MVKGNYCPREYKTNAIELAFSESTFLFQPTGQLVSIDQLGEQRADATRKGKEENLLTIADEIFGNKILSYSDFLSRYRDATGKAVATAKRAHADLVGLQIITECQGGYRLTTQSETHCESLISTSNFGIMVSFAL